MVQRTVVVLTSHKFFHLDAYGTNTYADDKMRHLVAPYAAAGTAPISPMGMHLLPALAPRCRNLNQKKRNFELKLI